MRVRSVDDVVILCRTSEQIFAALAEHGIENPRCIDGFCRYREACDAQHACVEIDRLHREMAEAGIVYRPTDPA